MTTVLGPLPCIACGRIVYVSRTWLGHYVYLIINVESHDIHACTK